MAQDTDSILEQIAGEVVLMDRLDPAVLQKVMAMVDSLGDPGLGAPKAQLKTALLDAAFGQLGTVEQAREKLSGLFQSLRSAWNALEGKAVGRTVQDPDRSDSEVAAPGGSIEIGADKKDILREFIVESRDQLDRIEVAILEWEAYPDDKDVINAIFRAFHSIKGSAGFLNVTPVQELAHELESLLDAARDGKLRFSSSLADLVLKGVDTLTGLLDWAEKASGKRSAKIPKTNAGEIIDHARLILEAVKTGTHDPRLGALLLRESLAAPREVHQALKKQSEGDTRRLGDILVDEAVVTQEAIDTALTNKHATAGEAVQKIELSPAKLEEYKLGIFELLDELDTGLIALEENPEDEAIVRVNRGLKTLKMTGEMFGFDDMAGVAGLAVRAFEAVRDGAAPLSKLLIDSTHAAGELITSMIGAGEGAVLVSETARRNVEQNLKAVIAGHEDTDRGRRPTGVNLDMPPPPEPLGIDLDEARGKDIRDRLREGDAGSSIRVPAVRLDGLVDLVGELVTVQARLSQIAGRRNDPQLLTVSEEVERLTVELRDNTMSIRMVPIGTLFGKFKRLVRDLARDLDKELDLTTSGEETELDKTVIDRLNDPLVHLVRNSVDHGVEPPQEREAKGKPRRGKVELSAFHSGTSVFIQIKDDGAGLDAEAIRAKAVERGLLAPDAHIPDSGLFAMIFEPGFSTARSVSNVSGRGVGMDVVKRNIDSLGGSIEIRSTHGAGAAFTLKLPLTLAIIEGFLVQVGAGSYVLPLSVVEECVEITRAERRRAGGRRLINLRGEIVPYVDLRDLFGMREGRPDVEVVVITSVASTRVGFVVDHVVGEHQTVVKSLGRCYRNAEGVSGASILGDGSVALILDLASLLRHVEHESAGR